ncbi:hypothetical protein A6U87_21070 [Rhizobium sp. AC44/96]|uniref:hypothetical protein n=1 Tax=unclassified Rhizobium TaxID=2613769 RepID=UPI00081011D6|nr:MULTISPECIES: hypothetical protein [unclassified Rhizobium]MDM9622024.1 hypothetical protein [Rhizobium sp. S96]OCJ17289.1 hypothetical protein A6U87_21070 [Rhizobium sp. AC44/96]
MLSGKLMLWAVPQHRTAVRVRFDQFLMAVLLSWDCAFYKPVFDQNMMEIEICPHRHIRISNNTDLIQLVAPSRIHGLFAAEIDFFICVTRFG